MGIDEMVKGVSFVVSVMGLFGIGELLITVEEEFHVKAISSKVEWPRRSSARSRAFPRLWLALLRSAAIGCWMGITPGGPTAASFMSYGIAKRPFAPAREFRQGRAGEHRRSRKPPIMPPAPAPCSLYAVAGHSRDRQPPP